jgi:shikimate 5-dehydrogenase
MELNEAKVPTMYFVGVSTGDSSSKNIFPRWAETLGILPCELVGIDLKIHDDANNYRDVVKFIKEDPLSLGALVTTHKMDLMEACRNEFDIIDSLASELGEVSSIYKRDGKLCARATDPECGGLALQNFLPSNYFNETDSELLILGAGGSSLALVWYFLKGEGRKCPPSKIHVLNRSQGRLDHLMNLAEGWGSDGEVVSYHAPDPSITDQILNNLKPESLVVNATGLGKDAPGSPITDSALFPEKAIAWDFNYRGELNFLAQARSQKQSQNISIVDGWHYFVIGWSQVISDIFNIEIPTNGMLYEVLSKQAKQCR